MALTPEQLAALDLWASRQFDLRPGGQLGGAVSLIPQGQGPINLGSALSAVQTRTVSVPFELPAPDAGEDVDIPVWRADVAGKILDVKIVPMTEWAAGDNVGDTYLTAVRNFSGTPANVSFAHDLVAGVAAADAAVLPTGEALDLLTEGDDLTIAATGAQITLTHETDLVNLPVVGDFISITCAATNFVGTGVVNPGVYVVTAVTSAKIVVASKVFGADPVAVSIAATASGDVAGIQLIRQTEASFAAGDLLGLRVSVPADTTTPVDLSAVKFLAVIRYRTTV